jgi:putative ABC transport system permease protein
MAWRDSRRNRSRLLLFVSSIILGIAALVAINSFGDNLRASIELEARSLLGADLLISSNQPVPQQVQAMLDTLGNDRSRESSFASMIYFPRTGGTRLVQVRALEGDFPYYGEIETEPAEASTRFRTGRRALVEQTLLLQFGAQIGDSIQVGELRFLIEGQVNKMPGQTGIAASVAPAVYIPLEYLEETGLLQKGSRIVYRHYYRFPEGYDVDKLVEQMEPVLGAEGLNTETVEGRKESAGNTYANLTQFLTLVAFIALLLGCVGVASAVHIYVKEKLPTIAILRCLGANGSQAFLIFLFQIMAMGLLGSVIGALLGSLIQRVLPEVFSEFLPFEVAMVVSWRAIGQGIMIGLGVSLLFALLPLIAIRNISPLNTLRASFDKSREGWDLLRWGIYLLIIGFVLGFAYLQMQSWRQAGIFTASVLGAFVVLALLAWSIMWLVRRFFPSSWSYLWRQSLANLYRPNNQTLILIVSIGLGTALISVLYFAQSLLINQVSLSGSGHQPNMVLFDIQPGQKEEVTQLTTSHGLPLLQQVPVVTMRLEEVNGMTASKVKADTTVLIPQWAFTREYRITYRDTLIESEKNVAGTWRGNVKQPGDTVFISVEEGYAGRINVKVGDRLLFNVQGALIPTVVGHLRKVEWNRIQSNFLVVFPAGVLETAPQFHVLMTRVDSNEASARFQQELVRNYPNVSVVDLALILGTLDEILGQIAFVIRFMALFSIVTGLLVLISSVLISKFQRIQESVLLRTLGASRRQILVITTLEYFLLGSLASLTGILLSLAGSWGLARFSFETPFRVDGLPVLVIYLLVTGLTVGIGLLNSRGILSRPPLEVLRNEV